tara:strand:- start:9 stop:431 length:423 start_codon:yes stop_codon:yes gene_type:complete
MNIRKNIIDKYPEETFLFADGFDEAIIGIDSKFIVCYDQDKCIEILARDCATEEDASEYFWYNVEGAYMGEKTPRFIKRFQIIKPNIDLDVSAEHNMPTNTSIFESPDQGKTIYKRKFGDYDNREEITSGPDYGEGEGHD